MNLVFLFAKFHNTLNQSTSPPLYQLIILNFDYFKTLSNIQDGAFCETSYQKPLTIFVKRSILDVWQSS